MKTHCAGVTAVDFSEEMLSIARRKVNDGRVQFLQADITKPWDFGTEKVDLVTCNLILEHVENIESIFQQCAFKLNNNGYFFISEYHPYRQYLGKQARFEKDGKLVLIPSFVHHVSEFLDAGKRNGFQLLELREWMDEEDGDGVPRLVSMVFNLT